MTDSVLFSMWLAMFKLKVQNVAFFALAPSLFSRYCYQQAINDRVDVLWRIHENREKKGLKGTKNAYNMYDEDELEDNRSNSIDGKSYSASRALDASA